MDPTTVSTDLKLTVPALAPRASCVGPAASKTRPVSVFADRTSAADTDAVEELYSDDADAEVMFALVAETCTPVSVVSVSR
eukprot:COSAG02_NODE_39085_length_421_cov_0.934783_1_plen_81_part_00